MEIKLRLFGPPSYEDNWVCQWHNWNYHKDSYKNIQIVKDDSYTHAVVFGFATPKLKVPKEKVIGFSCEPNALNDMKKHVEWASNNVSKYFCNDPTGLPSVFEGSFTFLAPTPFIHVNTWKEIKKEKFCSIIASNKTQLKGHKYRHEIIKEILKTDLPIDIYGRGLENLYHDKRIRGSIDDKNKALLPYHYTITIENVIEPYYITEKFYDPILTETTPLYWGSSYPKLIFGENCYIDISNNAHEVINLLRYLNQDPPRFVRDVKTTKQKILKQEIGMPEFIWKYFTHGK